MKETITLKTIVGEHPEKEDTIIISITGTGIDITNPKHKHFMEVIVNVIGSQMYAKANNIPMKNVKY